jgi:hypothetical protein
LRENIGVSPRRNRRDRSKDVADRDIENFSPQSTTLEDYLGIDYEVRQITGSTSNKPYRCPGCDQLIPTATPHIVAWPLSDIESRRHWHVACWKKRNNRQPNTLRTRGAPKY